MKQILLNLFAALFLLTGPVLADGHGHSKDGLSFENAWARATIGNSKNSVVYVKFKNKTKKDITLVSATSEVSGRSEFHTHLNENGVMKMRAIEGGLKIPAGGTAELKPGGKHIMLMGLKTKLSKGDQFKLELTTASGKKQSLKVIVSDKAPGGHEHHDGHKDHSGHKH